MLLKIERDKKTYAYIEMHAYDLREMYAYDLDN